jgi:ATP-binding cassette subfamily C protein LapB
MLTYAPIGIPRATLIAATLSVVVLELITPITIRQVYNSFIPNQSLGSLQVMMAVAITCLAAEVLLRGARALLTAKIGAAHAHRAGCHLMGAMLDGRMPGAASQSVAAKLSLITLVRSFRETGSGMRAITLSELVLVPLNMALIGLIAGKLVLVSLVLVGGFLLFTTHLGSRLMAAREERQHSDATRIDLMVEMLGAVSTIKAMSTERIMTERYSHRKYESALENLKVARDQTFIFDLTSTFATTLVLCVIFYGAYLTVSAELTLGSMIAAIILTGRTMPPLQRAIAMLNRRQEDQLDERKVEAVLAISPGPARLAPEDCPPNAGGLALRKAMLAPLDRSQRDDLILGDVSLDIPALTTTLIDGANHGDISLFLRSLAGLHPLAAGEVLLNGTPIETLPDGIRTRQVAYLQAETVLYRGSIMDNLTRFGQVPVSDVMFVARHLALDHDVQVLSRGYDTLLRGDGGDPVPPGLRQRIALARALAPRPRVVIFDHADTGLDRRSYTALFELFAKLRGHATVIVASRDGTMRGLAEQGFTLREGRLDPSPIARTRRHSVVKYRELRI